MSDIKISVVIPSYDSQDTIGKTLESVYCQETVVPHEVIVVDSSPHDEVSRAVRSFPNAVFVHENKKTYAGIARNLGTQRASGELMVFLDADIVLKRDALQHVWNMYQKGHEIFAGSLELRNNERNLSARMEHYLFFHQYQVKRRRASRPALPSTCFVIKKEIFVAEGGFGDLRCAEDVEFTERLYFIPDVQAYRIQQIPFKTVLQKNFFFGNNLFFSRYRSMSVFTKTLFFIELPVLSLFKSLKIMVNNSVYQRFPYNIDSVLLSPVIFAAGFLWMAGLYHAMITRKRIR
jgi:glycosyltransferase involved in cell wall biosynthesis